jgi:hypothetical protein
MVTATHTGGDEAVDGRRTSSRPVIRTRAPFLLSAALVVVAGLAAGLSFFARGPLLGPAVSIGSLRGTALVLLVVALPVVVVGMLLAARGSVRGLIVWLGGLGVLLYNAVMFAFATPLNAYFPVYVAMLGLSWGSLAAVLLAAPPIRVAEAVPARSVATYIWVVVGLNALAWLGRIVPAIVRDDPQSLVAGTGVTTNPVYVQDLAFWLPVAAVAAYWLWQRRPGGLLLSGAVLVMWVVEGVSVAVDQWFAHAADPASPVASAAMAPAFAVVAAIGLVPVYLLLRRVTR